MVNFIFKTAEHLPDIKAGGTSNFNEHSDNILKKKNGKLYTLSSIT